MATKPRKRTASKKVDAGELTRRVGRLVDVLRKQPQQTVTLADVAGVASRKRRPDFYGLDRTIRVVCLVAARPCLKRRPRFQARGQFSPIEFDTTQPNADALAHRDL